MAARFEETLQDNAAATAFQLVWGAVKNLGHFIAYQDAIHQGMQQYARNFLERHGKVKVLGMTEPIPLRDIYTAAQIVSPRALRGYRTTDDLQEMFLQQGRRGFFLVDRQKTKRLGLELANEEQFLNVLGAPGAGKSTFLRRLGVEALLPRRTWSDTFRQALGLEPGRAEAETSTYNHNCLPVLIELRRFRTDELHLPRLVQNELSIYGLPESARLAETLLSDGRLLLLLDGLDELPGDRLDDAIAHLRDFTDRYADNRFVTSCRTAFYKDYFPRFTDVLLADFDDEQIGSFVRNWFRSAEDRQLGTSEEFLRLLDDPTNASAKELASSPLLLTFLCLTYDDRQRLPANRSALYRQALEILMERWAASKRVHNEPIYRELHAELEAQMLAEIAAPEFRDNHYFFNRYDLKKRIAEFLRNELNAPRHINSDQILEAIEIQQGIIIQRAHDTYSFSHLTLQEYLTAAWYVDNQQTAELIRDHLFDDRWREVFILTAGILGKADDFLLQMQTAAGRVLASRPLAVQLLRWSKYLPLPSEDEPRNTAKRILYLALAIARHSSFDDELYSALTQTLKLAFTLDGTLPPGDTQRYLAEYRDILHDDYLDSDVFDEQVERARALLIFELSKTYSLSADFFRLPMAQVIAAGPPDKIEKRSDSGESNTKIINTAPGPKRYAATEFGAYMHACELVAACKNAATRVTRSAWNGICSLMLDPVM
ncbi:hypothetical protein F0U61_29935 [Archangium violaceum]|uniref:NACHT domain-containing protein n=1 Tax=Archangium violaceum TaxID=83451 RepID=UPI002B3115CF|nr:hypothetical protein F0U61_29935 [Archangium violaceum]